MKKTVYLLLICIVGVVHSCKEDEGVLKPESHNHAKFKHGMVSFQDMKAKLSGNSTQSFALFENLANKGGESYITAIDTTRITQITNGEITSFTMHVSTKDDEHHAYSNLVIKYQNGQIEEYLLHYNPTPEWQSAFDAGERLPYEGELIKTDIYGRAVGGQTCMLEITIACYGSSCPCTDGNGTTTYVTISCGGGGGDGDNDNPTDPTPGGFDPMDGGGGGSYTDFDYFMMGLSNQQKTWLMSSPYFNQIYNYLENNDYSPETESFALWAIGYLMDNPNTTFDELLRTRTSYNSQTGDVNNNSVGGYDNTLYPILAFPQVLQNWPSIPNVIPANEFVGWDFRNHPNWDCMDYAKEQIRIKGYQISNYGDSGQTFQIYKEQTGVNLDALSKGLSYLKYALSNGNPVIVGIDNRQGSPNPQTDNTTDHFIVIVGTGIENGEIFFRFYDNASGYPHQGTHLENKLYLDNFLNMLIGTTRAEGYRESYTDYDYIVTQIRKSKPL